VSVVLLALFFAVELRAEQPVTPLALFKSRNRAGGYATGVFSFAALVSVLFFITQFLENVLGYSPIRTGLAFLPLTLSIVVSARTVGKLIPKFGARPILIVASALSLAAALWMTRLDYHSSYAAHILGPLVLFGVGVGLCFPPLNATILAGVPRQDAGAASGLLQATQWVGGSLGLGVLASVMGTATRHATAHPAAGVAAGDVAKYALTHGISNVYTVGATFSAAALVICTFIITSPKQAPAATPVPAPAKAAEPAAAAD
jgi:MFS family permease